MKISIPFSGFYESIHNDNINNALYNDVFTDHASGCINNDRLSYLAEDSIDWHLLYVDYAKEYVSQFNHEYGLNLIFDELSSPKEYNFTTDRIFCEITPIEIHKLYENTSAEYLTKNAKAMFTSYDGFSSFYSNDWLTWGADVLTWDCNQLECLLRAWLEGCHDITSWNDVEFYLMDDPIQCNGLAYELIYTHCSNKRLFTISDYLNKRAERT
jgi:hypothetical protein